MTYDQGLQVRLRALGDSVREARRATGLSQEALADRAGLHRTYVGSLERGERNPTVGTLYRLADTLGLDLLRLLEHRDGLRVAGNELSDREEPKT